MACLKPKSSGQKKCPEWGLNLVLPVNDVMLQPLLQDV